MPDRFLDRARFTPFRVLMFTAALLSAAPFALKAVESSSPTATATPSTPDVAAGSIDSNEACFSRIDRNTIVYDEATGLGFMRNGNNLKFSLPPAKNIYNPTDMPVAFVDAKDLPIPIAGAFVEKLNNITVTDILISVDSVPPGCNGYTEAMARQIFPNIEDRRNSQIPNSMAQREPTPQPSPEPFFAPSKPGGGMGGGGR